MALRRCGTCNGSGSVPNPDPESRRWGNERIRCAGECRGEGWLVIPDEPQG